MTTVHPLLQDRMVLWKGKDERKGFCYYTFSPERLAEGRRSICFLESVAIFEKLGFEIGPHWTMNGQIKGWFSVKGIRYHGPFDSVEDVELSPVVQMIIKDEINNKSMQSLLSMEEE